MTMRPLSSDIVVKALEGEVEEEDSNTIESHDLIVNRLELFCNIQLLK